MSISVKRVILDYDCDCHFCQSPLMPGEVAYVHEESWTTGCNAEHATLAAEAKMSIFEESEPSCSI